MVRRDDARHQDGGFLNPAAGGGQAAGDNVRPGQPSIMLVTLKVVCCGSRPNRFMAFTTRWSRTGSTPSGKAGSEMNATVSLGISRYCSMASSTAARSVSAISCPWDSARVNAFRVLGYFCAQAAVTA